MNAVDSVFSHIHPSVLAKLDLRPIDAAALDSRNSLIVFGGEGGAKQFAVAKFSQSLLRWTFPATSRPLPFYPSHYATNGGQL